MSVFLHEGDCLDVLKTMSAESVDSVVTDPPYGLAFMGRKWDYNVPTVAIWREALRVLKPGGHLLSFSGTRTYHRMVVAIEDAGFEIRDQIGWLYGSGFPKSRNLDGDWQGWGSALKPAWEPIVLARKPFTGTVAENVLAHGTGAMNIDGCRIPLNGDYKCKPNGRPSQTGLGDNYDPSKANLADHVGRWPANIIHDGSGEVIEAFAECRTSVAGSASRFFYCAKTSKSERNGSKHPTIKPVSLMRYLCRLVTPPNGIILDPFAGTGSTGQAAVDEGFNAFLIEQEAEYCATIRRRLALWLTPAPDPAAPLHQSPSAPSPDASRDSCPNHQL